MPHLQRQLMHHAALRRHALLRAARYGSHMVTSDKPPVREPRPSSDSDPRKKPHRDPSPPDAIPDPMPGVDPQQTPGTDRPPLAGMQQVG